MRTKNVKNGPLTARAIAGAYVVVLAWDIEAASWKTYVDDLLGFAIERSELRGDKAVDTHFLQGLKGFDGDDKPKGGDAPPKFDVSKHPIQAFQWGDYTAKPGVDYSYRVIPVRGTPGTPALQDAAAVKLEVKTESEDDGDHAIWFNRGVAASQEYARKFERTKPDENDPTAAPMQWLSRGLYEALLAFLETAEGKGYALRGALYEFHYAKVVEAFKAAVDRGVDVQILYDQPTYGAENLAAIKAAELTQHCKPRAGSTANKHNKFVVLLKDDAPIAVWTGSTNISAGGIFGHSNVGHLVRKKDVAARYLDYWKLLWDNLEAPAKDLRPKIMEQTPTPAEAPPPRGVSVMFSPRDGKTLDWYAEAMGKARRMMCFTVAFTVAPPFEEELEGKADALRFILKDAGGKTDGKISESEGVLVAIGSKFEPDSLENFIGESLTGFNEHVEYIHDKFMLVDPLGDDPVVLTGSANFSGNSMSANDENMLLIRGDQRVADIYFGEFMRLFDHLYARYLVKRARDKGEQVSGALKPAAAWIATQTTPTKAKRRHYFAGTA